MADSSKFIPTIEGSTKAWANLDGSGTIALRDSFNITSVTDNGTGDYIFNFTNDFAIANYNFTTGYGDTSQGINKFIGIDTTPTSSAFRLQTQNSGASQQDQEFVCCSMIGELA